jgi:hypothetical protein
VVLVRLILAAIATNAFRIILVQIHLGTYVHPILSEPKPTEPVEFFNEHSADGHQLKMVQSRTILWSKILCISFLLFSFLFVEIPGTFQGMIGGNIGKFGNLPGGYTILFHFSFIQAGEHLHLLQIPFFHGFFFFSFFAQDWLSWVLRIATWDCFIFLPFFLGKTTSLKFLFDLQLEQGALALFPSLQAS